MDITTQCPPCQPFATDDGASFVRENRSQFGPTLDPIQKRLHGWSNTSGTNMRRVGATLYSWTANPRVQQNGSALGRVYAKKRGENEVDIGGFKIDRDGNIVAMPDDFRAALGEVS